MTRTLLAIAGLCIAFGFVGAVAIALPDAVALPIIGFIGVAR